MKESSFTEDLDLYLEKSYITEDNFDRETIGI